MSADVPDNGGRRRRPKQTRSVETFNSILTAASTLFAKRGYEPSTTHQIAAEAGISVGTLYRYFADKEAIFKELYRKEISELRNRLLEGFDLPEIVGHDVEALVRKTVALAFEVYSERPQLRRVLREQSLRIPELAAERREQEAQLHFAVAQLLSSPVAVQVPDVELGAYLITLFIESLMDDYILHRRDTFDERRVIDGATDFILRYALGRLEPSSP